MKQPFCTKQSAKYSHLRYGRYGASRNLQLSSGAFFEGNFYCSYSHMPFLMVTNTLTSKVLFKSALALAHTIFVQYN